MIHPPLQAPVLSFLLPHQT